MPKTSNSRKPRKSSKSSNPPPDAYVEVIDRILRGIQDSLDNPPPEQTQQQFAYDMGGQVALMQARRAILKLISRAADDGSAVREAKLLALADRHAAISRALMTSPPGGEQVALRAAIETVRADAEILDSEILADLPSE